MADRLKAWVLVGLAASAGILLALGFGLTWAQLHSEGLPALSVLSALPNSYFIGAALQTALVPLAMATFTGLVWIPISINRRIGGKRPYKCWWWALVGFVLALEYRALGVQTSAGKGHDTLSYIGIEAAFSFGCMVVAVGIGALHNLVTTSAASAPSMSAAAIPGSPEMAPGGASPSVMQAPASSLNTWALVGPLIAGVLLLSTFTAGVLGIADTLHTRGQLPVAQVVLDTSCTNVSDGRLPYDEGDGEAERRCLIGGYYIGESSNWVYLVKRRSECGGKKGFPARLVEFRRSEISEMIILSKPICPRKGPCGGC